MSFLRNQESRLVMVVHQKQLPLLRLSFLCKGESRLVPAQAGIQAIWTFPRFWIPTFVGMTPLSWLRSAGDGLLRAGEKHVASFGVKWSEFLTTPNGEPDIPSNNPFYGKIHRIENLDNLIHIPKCGGIASIRINLLIPFSENPDVVEASVHYGKVRR